MLIVDEVQQMTLGVPDVSIGRSEPRELSVDIHRARHEPREEDDQCNGSSHAINPCRFLNIILTNFTP